MKKTILIFIAVLCSSVLFGCTSEKTFTTFTTKNPTAADILINSNTDADILLWDSIVYQTNIDWVNELTLTQAELLGVIASRTSDPTQFIHSTANILPIGTEIYRANERGDILIAIFNEEIKYYYKLVEG